MPQVPGTHRPGYTFIPNSPLHGSGHRRACYVPSDAPAMLARSCFSELKTSAILNNAVVRCRRKLDRRKVWVPNRAFYGQVLSFGYPSSRACLSRTSTEFLCAQVSQVQINRELECRVMVVTPPQAHEDFA